MLSSELEPDRIEANLTDGVLSLRIPKRAEHTPRKIQLLAGSRVAEAVSMRS